MSDAVNSPKHYTSSHLECIESIEAQLSPEEMEGFLKGNVLKYLWRSNHKGTSLQDLKKAQWYLNKLEEFAPKLRESWATFPTDDRYEVSSFGNLRRADNHKPVKWSNGGSGYAILARYRDGVFSGMYAHEAVLAAFRKQRPLGMQILHLNGNKKDNRLVNLMYGPSSCNMEMQHLHGVYDNYGTLPDTVVSRMIQEYVSGEYSQYQLASRYGLSRAQVGRIVTGSSHKRLTTLMGISDGECEDGCIDTE